MTMNNTNPHEVDVPEAIKTELEVRLRDAFGAASLETFCWHEPPEGVVAAFAIDGTLHQIANYHASLDLFEQWLEAIDLSSLGLWVESVNGCDHHIYKA